MGCVYAHLGVLLKGGFKFGAAKFGKVGNDQDKGSALMEENVIYGHAVELYRGANRRNSWEGKQSWVMAAVSGAGPGAAFANSG